MRLLKWALILAASAACGSRPPVKSESLSLTPAQAAKVQAVDFLRILVGNRMA